MNERKESLSFKSIFKNEVKVVSYVIICLTIVVISLSYAMFFQIDGNSKNQEIVAGDLTFTFSGSNEITSTTNKICFEPMTLDEAGVFISDCSYQFSVTNTGSLKANYTLKLVENTGNTMEKNKVKVILRKEVGGVYQVVDGYPKTIDSLTDGVLKVDELNPNGVSVYSLQLYVDEASYVDGDNTKKIAYKIEGTGIVHESQPLNTDINRDIISQLDTTGLCPTINEDETINVKDKEETNGYLCKVKDDYGDSYYFRGNVLNNYVKFGGHYWRIIRINGDESVRMIYAGDASVIDALDESIKQTVLANGYDDSTTKYTLVGESAFNSFDNHNAYLGYMYGNIDGTTYEEVHKNTFDSAIKTVVDNWYKEHFFETEYESFISDTLFCNDRSISPYTPEGYLNTGVGTDTTVYRWNFGPWSVRATRNYPTLSCKQKNDRFTKDDGALGNASLTYPVGLISKDEAVLAGGYNTNNLGYYLYTGYSYWGSSPSRFSSTHTKARGFNILGSGDIQGEWVSDVLGIRPVINLKAKSLNSGTGTSTDPYLVS